MQTTFPRLLLKHAAERPEAPAMREKEYGIWQAHSWAGMRWLNTLPAACTRPGYSAANTWWS